MNDKFDELTKRLAQSVTRRQALRRFGVGCAGAVIASLGFVKKAEADPKCRDSGRTCKYDAQCCSGYCVKQGYKVFGLCY